jgi:transcriptional regulator with XRE-family HTH domain
MAMKEWHRASLAERIHLHRIWLNMSAEELARQSGISTSYLSKIERGRSVPSVDVLERLAAGLGTTASQLLSDAPPFTETPERHSHTPEAVMVHRLRPTVVRKGERKKIRHPIPPWTTSSSRPICSANSNLPWCITPLTIDRSSSPTWVKRVCCACAVRYACSSGTRSTH